MAGGTHFAVNPQTGERLALMGGRWVPATNLSTGTPGGGPKLTEDQGKAETYAKLMRNAEQSYDRSVERGYNPASLRNTLASGVEGMPWHMGDGLAAAARDDVSDAAHQAELQWSDAQLKAVSGAASPEPEVKRNLRTYFPSTGEDPKTIAPQKRQARETAFEGAVTRAGPAASNVGSYPVDLQPAARQTYRRMFSQGRIDPHAPMGSIKNPYSPKDPRVMDALPKGAYVVTPDGHFGVVE